MPLARRLLLDFVVGLVALGSFLSTFLMPDLLGWGPTAASLMILLVGAAVAGYREPSLTLVWLHTPILLALELPLALLVLLAFPRGFEATPFRFLATGVLLAALVLLGASFAGFFLRRWRRGRQPETSKEGLAK